MADLELSQSKLFSRRGIALGSVFVMVALSVALMAMPEAKAAADGGTAPTAGGSAPAVAPPNLNANVPVIAPSGSSFPLPPSAKPINADIVGGLKGAHITSVYNNNGQAIGCDSNNNCQSLNMSADDYQKASVTAAYNAEGANVSAPNGAGTANENSPGFKDKYGEKDTNYDMSASQQKQQSADACPMSVQLDGSMGCSGAKTFMKAAQITNVVSLIGGQAATQYAGMQAQTTAQTSGTQSSALEGAASTQKLSGELQMGTGLINAAMATAQFYIAKTHGNAADKIQKEVLEQHANVNMKDTKNVAKGQDNNQAINSTGQENNASLDGNLTNQDATQLLANGINNWHLNQGEITTRVTACAPNDSQCKSMRSQFAETRMKQLQNKENSINNALQDRGNTAKVEQTAVHDAAMAGGMLSTIQAASGLIQGAANMAAANQLQKAADQLKKDEQLAASVKPPTFNNFPGADQFAPGHPATITGNGQPMAAAAQDAASPTDNSNLAGNPFNVGGAPTGLNGNSPPAGKFGPSNPGAGPPAGAAAGLGGASTQANNEPNTDPAPHYGDNKTDGSKYDGGAGGTFAGGGGGGGGNPGMPDLQNLLSQFQPKKEEELAKGGIMDYGGRSPASELQDSLLGRDANLFQRVSENYQAKQKRREIGI